MKPCWCQARHCEQRGHGDLVVAIICQPAADRIVAEAGPGDFIYVPPYVPHQEIVELAASHGRQRQRRSSSSP